MWLLDNPVWFNSNHSLAKIWSHKMIKTRPKLSWILVFQMSLVMVTLWSGAAGPWSPASVSDPLWHHKPPVPSLAFQLQQQVYISICPTINLMDLSETELQLIELLFYKSRLEKSWDQTWESRFREWRQSSPQVYLVGRVMVILQIPALLPTCLRSRNTF